MWSKSSIATLAIASLALIGSATTPDNCPSDLACCTTADFRRSIFPRTVCPASQKQCCQRNGKVTHVSPLSDTLQCGKSTEAVAPLSIEIAACPSDITKQCLHFNYGSNTDGINYVDVHLGIYTTALSSFVPPGQLNAKNYCSLTNGGATAGCWIPLTDLSNIYLGGADVCTSSLYVVAHVSYPDSGSINGNTCYGQGSDVGGSNWAMQFQITLSCTQECIKQCCCPSQVPDVWCPVGTAYGYNSEIAIAENTLSSTTCKHWGWYLRTAMPSVSGTLYVGAGNNDISKATDVGTFSITQSGVQYTFSSAYKATETHVYAKCLAPTDCSPGKLGYTADSTGFANIGLTCSTSYYYVVHAAVSKKYPGDTDCSTVTVT